MPDGEEELPVGEQAGENDESQCERGCQINPNWPAEFGALARQLSAMTERY